MTDIVGVLKKRFIEMRKNGVALSRQQRFIDDAIANNRRYATKITSMAKKIEPLIESHYSAASPKQHFAPASLVCPQRIKTDLNALTGQMAYWYLAVSLPASIRNEILSPAHNNEVRALRKSSLTSGDVCKVLGMSLNRLNTLDNQGILPHRFKKRMEIDGNIVQARCWLLLDVVSFKEGKSGGASRFNA